MKIITNYDLGSKLRTYRESKGYSQMNLTIKMHLYGSELSESSYSKIEQGRRNIYLRDLVILKLILKFEYSDIFSELETEILKSLNSIQ